MAIVYNKVNDTTMEKAEDIVQRTNINIKMLKAQKEKLKAELKEIDEYILIAKTQFGINGDK